MIFITIGTTTAPFGRLVGVAALLARDEEVVVQYGVSARPVLPRAFAYASDATVRRLLAEARVVVCHGGVGSISGALSEGKRPIVVPRRRVFHEHVDDHQLALCRRLAQLDLVELVEDVNDLPRVVRLYRNTVAFRCGTSPELIESLRARLGVRVPGGASADPSGQADAPRRRGSRRSSSPERSSVDLAGPCSAATWWSPSPQRVNSRISL
jgi:UDP-N-acetylglucosamine transferase subunit ALG13